MIKSVFFVLISILLISNVSADNVTIEILENADGEYYISYGRDLVACVDDECTFDVDEYSSNVTDYELSNREITKIAQRVAFEVDFPDHVGVNESFILSALGDNREDITDNLRSHTMNTIVPSIAEMDEFKSKLAIAEIRIVELESKEREYDRMQFISLMAMIGFIFIIITCTDAGKEALQYIGKFRRR